MKIHFVCTGNTFRSRLAEAYLKSKKIPNIDVSSSGVLASRNLDGSICKYVIPTIEKNHLDEFVAKHWTQTTKIIIEKQDLVIFMNEYHYIFCKNKLNCKIKRHKILDVDDIPPLVLSLRKGLNKLSLDDTLFNLWAAKRFRKIKKKTDLLLKVI